jgi:hypothetical protein
VHGIIFIVLQKVGTNDTIVYSDFFFKTDTTLKGFDLIAIFLAALACASNHQLSPVDSVKNLAIAVLPL